MKAALCVSTKESRAEIAPVLPPVEPLPAPDIATGPEEEGPAPLDQKVAPSPQPEAEPPKPRRVVWQNIADRMRALNLAQAVAVCVMLFCRSAYGQASICEPAAFSTAGISFVAY